MLVSKPSPSLDCHPLDWPPLSRDCEAMAEAVPWYERRWLIEAFFKVLKGSTILLDHR